MEEHKKNILAMVTRWLHGDALSEADVDALRGAVSAYDHRTALERGREAWASGTTRCGFPARASLVQSERSVDDAESPRRCGNSVTS